MIRECKFSLFRLGSLILFCVSLFTVVPVKFEIRGLHTLPVLGVTPLHIHRISKERIIWPYRMYRATCFSPYNGILHRDVGSWCVHSATGCTISEYYCYCAMSVSFPRICNEIFASTGAGLCTVTQPKSHCPRAGCICSKHVASDIFRDMLLRACVAYLQYCESHSMN